MMTCFGYQITSILYITKKTNNKIKKRTNKQNIHNAPFKIYKFTKNKTKQNKIHKLLFEKKNKTQQKRNKRIHNETKYNIYNKKWILTNNKNHKNKLSRHSNPQTKKKYIIQIQLLNFFCPSFFD